MAKKLLSFLGTSHYHESVYTLDGQRSLKWRFVQTALLEILRKQGEESWHLILFATDQAKAANWDRHELNSGGYACCDALNEESGYDGLRVELEKAGITGYQRETVAGEHSEADVWTLFNLFAGKIEDGDELIVDITHGYRSHPVVLLMALEYLTQVKRDVKISRICYGAYQDDSPDLTPIFDLRPMLMVRELAAAAAHARATRDYRILAKSLLDPFNLEAYPDKHRRFNDFFRSAATLSQSLFDCRIPELAARAKEVIKNYEALDEEIKLGPEYLHLRPIMKELVEWAKPFTGTPLNSISAGVSWALSAKIKHHHQGYILMSEGLRLFGETIVYQTDAKLRDQFDGLFSSKSRDASYEWRNLLDAVLMNYHGASGKLSKIRERQQSSTDRLGLIDRIKVSVETSLNKRPNPVEIKKRLKNLYTTADKYRDYLAHGFTGDEVVSPATLDRQMQESQQDFNFLVQEIST